MKIETIYLIEQSGFVNSIKEWAEEKKINVVSIDGKNEDLADIIDGVVLFHENHNFTKEDEEVFNFLVNNNRPGHRVDINGTLAATNSNFTMWLDRNRTKRLLMLGSGEIVKNVNLKRFLDNLKG